MYKLHVEREIACSHRLTLHDGKCKNLHGHNYYIVVDINRDALWEGGSSDGMLVDFGDIKEVIDNLDHKHLNDYFEVIKYQVPEGTLCNLIQALAIQPTSERLAEFIARAIHRKLCCKYAMHIMDICVKVYESKSNYAEFSGHFD